MSYQVGVFAVDGLSSEIVNEAQTALGKIASKYNCKFELKSQGIRIDSTPNQFIENLKITQGKQKSTFLSFGGEIEL